MGPHCHCDAYLQLAYDGEEGLDGALCLPPARLQAACALVPECDAVLMPSLQRGSRRESAGGSGGTSGVLQCGPT